LEQLDGSGQPIKSLESGDRQRRFVFLKDGKLHGLNVTGSVNDPTSFGPVEEIATLERSRAYQPGTRVMAGLAGESGRCLGSGWSSQHDKVVWTNGHEASLLLELPPVEDDLVLNLRFIPNVDPDKQLTQRVGVEVNGRAS